MKIIILGAGQVGSSVAKNLASEANDITLIDSDEDVLAELKDKLDIQTVCGQASHPEVLESAGLADADMLIAVTNFDEINMVACQIAHTLFHTPKKIARVRSVDYLSQQKLFSDDAIPIDVLISPDQVLSRFVERLIEYPGALQVLDFADGKVQLVAVRAYHDGPLVGQELREIKLHIPNVDMRVAAIYRKGSAIIPKGDFVIEDDDEVFFVAARQHIRTVMSELRKLDKPFKKIMLAGGGNIGKSLCESLERKYQVKVLERDRKRAEYLSMELDDVIVLLGDSADRELLLEENIDQMDVFCAVTNDDEANILSSMLAKRLGARKVMSLITRPAYVDLIEAQEGIDVAISPQQVTIGALLTHIRRGDVVAVHSLRRGAAEAIEAVAHGDYATSKVVGRRIEEIKLPKGASIGAIVRGEEVLMAHHDILIENDDHLILFMQDKRKTPEVEKLFQVAVTFM